MLTNEKYFAYCLVNASCNLDDVNEDIVGKLFMTLKEDESVVGISPSLTQDSPTSWGIMKNTKNKEKEHIYFIQNVFCMYRATRFNSIGRFARELKYGWGTDIETGYFAYRTNQKRLHHLLDSYTK